jgi:hypothetical protein
MHLTSYSQGNFQIRHVNIWEQRSVRFCRIKTTPRVEKKDLLEPEHGTVTLSGSECSGLVENV